MTGFDNTNPTIYQRPDATTSSVGGIDKLSTYNKCYSALSYGQSFLKEDGSKDVDRTIVELLSPTISHDSFDKNEIFDIVRSIKDPEYSYSLEDLKVIERDNIVINDETSTIAIYFTPTVPHCSQATLIGLMIYVKLVQSLPLHFKIDVQITKGTHDNEDAINKQLLDKERISAALENPLLFDLINDGMVVCLSYLHNIKHFMNKNSGIYNEMSHEYLISPNW
ncbi:hypothetical protein BEWA_010650 [Theileria equi strain WA]|uniref:MIP18 family-like domain-containing protein n=1 Tax=Theileria equi strain WA TaxID=1537102 RepID=L0B2C6_THEEQ|nr:hypothetical protein BEWA_010650 [Theileria equi strain WA]AFZ81648.1 hypothetical protein BEWA_010650 [Theileria equi strain WA]|eukprot:XP_004831314.1 hypothetical protein BEWA_010650 [Theileria equi strain WA]